MDPEEMSEELYERCRAKDIRKIMATINALPEAPLEPCVDLEPFRDLDAIYQAIRTSSPEEEKLKAPLDQLPIYLRVLPDDGAIEIPNYHRSTLNFGIPLTAAETILCALRLDMPISPVRGEAEEKKYKSCIASVRQAGHRVARYMTKVCRHRITFRYAAGLDGIFVFAMYSNYNRGKRLVEDRDEKVILDVIRKVVGGQDERPAKWYFEGYCD